MKITRSQLRRIIKEEKRKLQEQLEPGWDDVSGQDITDGYYNAINQMIWEEWGAAGVSPEENPEEIEYVKEALTRLLADLGSGNF